MSFLSAVFFTTKTCVCVLGTLMYVYLFNCIVFPFTIGQNRVAVSIQLLHPNATNSGTRAAANTASLLAGSNNTGTNTGSTASSLNRQSSFSHSSNNLKSLASTQLGTSAAGSANASAVSDLPPRVLILTEEGGMLIVDIEGFQLRSVGFYTVKVTNQLIYFTT